MVDIPSADSDALDNENASVAWTAATSASSTAWGVPVVDIR